MTISNAIKLAESKGIAFSKGDKNFKGYEYWTKESIQQTGETSKFYGTWGAFCKWLNQN